MQRHAENKAGEGEHRDAAVEDARRAQLVEDHADGEESEQPAPAAEKSERLVELQAGDAEYQQRDQDRQGQKPQHAEHQHHDVHHEFKAQGPHRTVDFEPDRVVDEHDPGQFMDCRAQQSVANHIAIRCRLAEIGARLQGRHERRQNKCRQQGRDKQTGEDTQRALRHKPQRVPGVLKALRHQKAANCKEDKDAGEAEDRLVAGQPDQPFVPLRAVGDQERMRKHHRYGGDKAQRVEIVLPSAQGRQFRRRQQLPRSGGPRPGSGP